VVHRRGGYPKFGFVLGFAFVFVDLCRYTKDES
jgi:hypothetical protein